MVDCLSLEELGALLDLDADNPRRRHAETCPRCAALLESLRSFAEMEPLPPGADLGDADARLDALRRERIEAPGAPARDAEAGAILGSSDGNPVLRVVESLTRGRLRPVLALAAFFLIALGFWRILDRPQEMRAVSVLRGESGDRASSPRLVSATVDGSAELRLTWRRCVGASAYRVALIGPDLEDLRTFEVKSDTILVLPLAEVRPLIREQRALFWGVSAWSGSDELGQSELRQLRLPD
jgi:hypothetical protein